MPDTLIQVGRVEVNTVISVVEAVNLGGSDFCFLRGDTESTAFVGVTPAIVARFNTLSCDHVYAVATVNAFNDDIVGFFFTGREEVIALFGVVEAIQLGATFRECFIGSVFAVVTPLGVRHDVDCFERRLLLGVDFLGISQEPSAFPACEMSIGIKHNAELLKQPGIVQTADLQLIGTIRQILRH